MKATLTTEHTGTEYAPSFKWTLTPTKGDALSGNGFMTEEAAKNVAATVAQVSGWKITEELQKWN